MASAARGRFAALCSFVLDRSLAPLLCMLCFETALPPSAPPRVALRCGPCLGPRALLRPLCECACTLRRLCPPLVSLLSSVCCLLMLLCRLWLYCYRGSAAAYASARRCCSALSATARGCLLLGAPLLLAATPLRVPSSERPVLATCPAAPGAPTSRTPWPVGAPPFLVRPLVGALLPITRSRCCSVCFFSWWLCYLVLLLLVGLCCRLYPGPWALLRPLCDCSWAPCCL